MAGLELADPFWDVQEADLECTRGHLEEEGLEFLASGRPPSALSSSRPISFRICDFLQQFWATEVKETRCLLPYLQRKNRLEMTIVSSQPPFSVTFYKELSHTW